MKEQPQPRIRLILTRSSNVMSTYIEHVSDINTLRIGFIYR